MKKNHLTMTLTMTLAAAALLGVGAARALTTYTWTGATDGDWANPGNWDTNGVPVDVYPSTPGLSFGTVGDKIVFDAAGSANPVPTSNIPTLQGHFLYDKQTPIIDLLYGTLSFTRDSYQLAFWVKGPSLGTVGDGDIGNGTATLTLEKFGMINRDYGGTENFTVNADGSLEITTPSGTLDVSYGTGRNATFTINGGSVTIGGAMKDLLLEPANFVDLTAAGSRFTANFGQDFADLAAVQAEIGDELSFRSTTGLTLAATDNGDGTFTVSIAPPPSAFPLTITPNSPDSRFQLAWASQAGMLYNVRSSADLSAELSTWKLVEGDIPASPDTNTYNVNPAEAVLFYRVEEFPPPPVTLLDEDFEADNGGFTAVNHTTGTIWMHGDPDSTGDGGTVSTGNGGSTNCWGTDIGNPGFYATGTETSLISPVIDLTAVAGATLSFAQAIDILAGDTLVVNVIDDTSDTVIEDAIHTSTPDPDTGTANWEAVDSIAISGAAIGQMVRIEWRFTGTNDGSYLGAYLDDVLVTAP